MGTVTEPGVTAETTREIVHRIDSRIGIPREEMLDRITRSAGTGPFLTGHAVLDATFATFLAPPGLAKVRRSTCKPISRLNRCSQLYCSIVPPE